MPTIEELTQEQFIGLLDEYFAAPEHRYKMTSEEIFDLARRLNQKINVPIIRESREEKILVKIVMKIDTFLYDHLPNEFYDLARDLDRGIDDEEAKRLIKRLAKLANRKIDIPYLPEKMEFIAIRFIIGVVVNGSRKNWDLARARNEVGALSPSSEADPDDEALESLVVAG